ncbi:EDSAP-1 family PEP-CTERM protein [Janthinobacterium fluminis]|uniref:PEP-CTERM sorting domain-containing protein n=1 Tax=Janthinobacterium fluminis TaxID=2987524 RepID=A0ABT5JUT4_9BURK|nr:EDSAP-1 family PEP-CTERM protein [Janthinobacterium fluminis]MDC8756180.1 PEP-CTERM sorting domain-containing protein [Janthinobacterium fluminis]
MKKTLLALAMTGFFAAGNAQASAYAMSFNDVTNLVITPTAGITFPPGNSTNNSNAVACLPNGNCVNNGGAGFINAPFAQVGAAPYADNSYRAANREANGNSFALADASIDSRQFIGDPFTRARNMAEGLLLETNTANITAGNSSATLLISTFVSNGNGTINFSFDAFPFIRAYLVAAAAGSQAEGILALNFNIVGSPGNTAPGSTGLVFNWAPDGIAGGILGGSESGDPYTMNISVTAMPGNPGPLVYDPSGCAPGGCFRATTNPLAAGTYTLNLSMRETVNLQLVQLPEPGSILLLGIGLAALGLTTRRRHAGQVWA